jgi:hypothetical protein
MMKNLIVSTLSNIGRKKTQPIKASPNSSKGREELAKAMREEG